MRVAYRWWSIVVFAMVVFQVGLAGFGAFYAVHKLSPDGATINENTFEDGFGVHMGFGYLVVLSGLILLVIGVIAGIGKWRLGRHGVLAGLLILQVLLAWFGSEAPVIGFFHPVNALVIFSLAGWIALDQWRGRRPTTHAPASA